MAIDVKAMIAEKASKKKSSQLVMKDVNRSLITALLAISVYGKDARDEEILSVIINAGKDKNPWMKTFRENYEKKLAEKSIKRGKDGVYRDEDGFIVLIPKE